MGQEIGDGSVSGAGASKISRCIGCSISAVCLVVGRDRIRENLLCCIGCKEISLLSPYARVLRGTSYATKVTTVGCFGVEDFDASIFVMHVPFLACPHCVMDPWRAKYL